MARRRSNSVSNSASNSSLFSGQNGGIAGSGIYGNFGTTIHCSSSDNSLYCNFMKIFNILMIVGIILAALYFIYITFFAKKRR